MARANVKTRVAYTLRQYGYVFKKDSYVTITDADLIEKLKLDQQYIVRDLTIDELLAKPDNKDDFLKPEPPAPVKTYKYHELNTMKKDELKELVYAMGIESPDEDRKKDLIEKILEKQYTEETE